MVRNNQVPPDTSLQTDRSDPGDRPGWWTRPHAQRTVTSERTSLHQQRTWQSIPHTSPAMTVKMVSSCAGRPEGRC